MQRTWENIYLSYVQYIKYRTIFLVHGTKREKNTHRASLGHIPKNKDKIETKLCVRLATRSRNIRIHTAVMVIAPKYLAGGSGSDLIGCAPVVDDIPSMLSLFSELLP